MDDMKYVKAEIEDAETVFKMVKDTIISIYPKYYPKEVVDFFCDLHSKERIANDIIDGNVRLLMIGDIPVGTGSYKEDHITRLYVSPDYRGKGYGTFIMDKLEDEIAQKYDTVSLDASLPASIIYEHRGYKTVKHERWECENGVMLVYEIMEKKVRK
jgi:GNAT superfamily N-acetyltransferase